MILAISRPAVRLLSLVWMTWLALLTHAGCAEVRFSGAKNVPGVVLIEVIAEQLQEIQSNGATPARADDAAFFLTLFYHKQGYSRASVQYELRGSTVVLKIFEGPRAVLRSISFIGNKNVDAAMLSKFFSGVPQAEIATANLPYHEADVTAGIERVRGYYVSEGWLNAAVETSRTRVSRDGKSADIVVGIIEGTRYFFGEVTFVGDTRYAVPDLVTALGAKPEGPFNPALVNVMQGSLRSWLRGRGHFSADVIGEADVTLAASGKVPLRFEVRAGPKFRVNGISQSGLDRVKPEFLVQRFKKITDANYNPALVDEKYRELLRTGLFRTLRIVPRKTGRDQLTLDIGVEEAKQKEFGFEIGFGSYDGLIAILRAGDRNFLRTGRSLTVQLQSSQRGFEGEILHVDPWFLESEWTLRTRLFSQFRDEEGYSHKGAGIRLEASRKLTSRWEVSGFTEFGYTTVTTEDIDPALLGPLDYTLAAVGVTQKFDYRDDPLNPRRGYIFSNSLELDALDGQLAFGRASARYSYYRTIGKSLIAAGVRFGWNIPVGEAADVPIDLRYFNGGGGTVRSFAERDLGPKDDSGHSLGGSFYTVANVEWDFPLTDALSGALFVDAGNLTSEATPSLEDMRLGLGAGVRYNLPIGPLRLDIGYNPTRREGEDIGAAHFSFGFAF